MLQRTGGGGGVEPTETPDIALTCEIGTPLRELMFCKLKPSTDAT